MTKSKETLLHSITECPGRKAIYVFIKVDGIAAPILAYTRLTKKNARVCDMIYDDGRTPVAWCYVNDLMKLIGWEKMLKASAGDMRVYRRSTDMYKSIRESLYPEVPNEGDDMMERYAGFFAVGEK